MESDSGIDGLGLSAIWRKIEEHDKILKGYEKWSGENKPKLPRAINLLQKELNRLEAQVRYESNRQVGNDLDESITQIRRAIEILAGE